MRLFKNRASKRSVMLAEAKPARRKTDKENIITERDVKLRIKLLLRGLMYADAERGSNF
jgi:hypothetical protein